MRKPFPLLLVAALVVLSYGSLHAIGFNSVHSPNGADVWAVGDTGRVYHSVDGGANWGSGPLGSLTFRSVFTMGLKIWIAGDNGTYYYSTNAGGSWTNQTINGGTRLNAVAFASSLRGWAAGSSGTIIATTDGGASWSAQTSGISQALYSLSFVDTLTGYASGAAGKLLKTTNGGSIWTSVGDPSWTKDIFSVSSKGGTTYVAGADEFCCRSTNAGGSWSVLNFKTDSKSDVNDVFAIAPDTAIFTGGGGYIRRSVDAGGSFVWGVHRMHAKMNDVFFYSSTKGWACSEKNYAVLSTTDGGLNWSLPTGTTVGYSWVFKISANTIGNSFCIDPWNKNRIFNVSGNRVYMSADRGEKWDSVAGRNGGGGAQHSFYISSRDSNIWVSAATGGGDGIKRSTNRGVNWSTSIAVTGFSNYGMPLEKDPDHPDTLFYMPDADNTGGSSAVGRVYRSTNFGSTWDTIAITSFRSPCDIMVVPDSTNIMYVADGITGLGSAQMWRSTNGGYSWTSIFSSGSTEIPMIGVSRMRKTQALSTAWSGTAVRKSTDLGLSWNTLASAPTGSTWGSDIAKDDPNVIVYGGYSNGFMYVSTDAGSTFGSASISSSNEGVLAYDRATILAQQGGGIYKHTVTYTVPVTAIQAVTVLSPNGGESWQYNSSHAITWTSSNFTNVKIEYKTLPGGSWQTIIASTPSAAGSYSWLVPNAPTSQARVRISDASDANPLDSSDAVFAITAAGASSSPASMNFGSVAMGAGKSDTVRITNTGTAPLVISSVTTGSAYFTPGRTSFSIPVGSSDTLSVLFSPPAAAGYDDTLRLNNNGPAGVLKVPLSGLGILLVPSLASPPDTSTNQPSTVTLVWNSVVSALSYHVRVSTDSLFGTLIADDTTMTGTTRQIGVLANSTPYFWKVRARNGGGYGAWSTAWRFTTASQTTNQYAVMGSWNMISLPLAVADARKDTLYPTASSNAYLYSGSGYIQDDTLDNGIGYWIKFPSAQNVSITGESVLKDTVAVSTGWNMVGTVTESVPVAGIQQVPSGVIGSDFYGYDGKYAIADTLQPGQGYWIKANQNGILIFDVTSVVIRPVLKVQPVSRPVLPRKSSR